MTKGDFARLWIVLQLELNHHSQHDSHWQITVFLKTDKPENWILPKFTAADVFLSPRNVFVENFLSFRRTVTYGNRGFVTHFNKVNVFVIDFKWQRSNALMKVISSSTSLLDLMVLLSLGDFFFCILAKKKSNKEPYLWQCWSHITKTVSCGCFLVPKLWSLKSSNFCTGILPNKLFHQKEI